MSRQEYGAALERAVLGLMLIDARLALTAEGKLEPGDFENQRHAEIFTILCELARAGRDSSPGAVAIELRRSGELSAEDEKYLMMLVTDPGAADVRVFDERVRALRTEGHRRRAVTHMAAAAKGARDRERDLSDVIGELRRALGEIESEEVGEELPLIEGPVDELIASIESGFDPGTPTGLPNLDDVISGGIKRGQMVLVAGATGSGKTSLATQIALLVAQWASRERDKRGDVLVFSLEMSAPDLTRRMINQVTLVADGFRAPHGWSFRDRPKVHAALERMRALPIRIRVPHKATPDYIRAAVERHINAAGKPSLVVVDHVGLLKDPTVRGGRVEEVGAITGALKRMAMQLDIPLLAIAQFNREPGKREDHRPQLSDLRESGSLEMDADVVLGVHTPSYYIKDADERRRLQEAGAESHVLVLKQRAGPTADVEFEWVGPRYLFRVPAVWAAREGVETEGGLIEGSVAQDELGSVEVPAFEPEPIEMVAPPPDSDDNPFA